MAAAVEAVVTDEVTPVEAVKKYDVPRRTLFRHMFKRREELGLLPTKQTSKKIKKEQIDPLYINDPSGIADRRFVGFDIIC